MSKSYNTFAGQNVGRIASLSDGVFSIAMTLLVLDLRAPAVEAIRSEADLWRALGALSPRLLMYVMTFLTLGIFWVGQQTQLNHLHRSDRALSWIHIAFLFGVSITPFSTNLLALFTTFRVALLVYWLNVFYLGATLYWSWAYATGHALVKDDVTEVLSQGIRRRVLVAQSLYAAGALLCFVSPYASIAVFLAVQLHYAVGLRLPGRSQH